jgi:spectinomycin phosphotransferase
MRDSPPVANETIVSSLQKHYGIADSALTFLPIGADAASSVYRADTPDGSSYLVKLRTAAGFSVPSLAIPHALASQGVPHILAPLPTTTQALWVELSNFRLSLYPFLQAHTGASVGLSHEQWRALGSTLRLVHASQPPSEARDSLPREAFIPSRRDVLRRLAPVIEAQQPADPVERELAGFWRSRLDTINMVLEHADRLGERLRQRSLPQVLCHADLHTWNVLVDSVQRLWIIDWDETILAPKERDLMFVIGGIGRDLVGSDETACVLEGYGHVALDQETLGYYRYAWAVQDMGAYAEEVFFSPERGQQSRRDAVAGFMALFEPGNIVDIARGSGATA